MRAVRVGAVFLAFAFLSSSSSARTNRRGSGSEAAWEVIDALDDHRRALISDYIMAVEDAAAERTKAEMATEDAAAAERAQAEIQELRQMMEELRRTVLTLGGAPPLQLATRTRALLASPTVKEKRRRRRRRRGGRRMGRRRRRKQAVWRCNTSPPHLPTV